MNTGLTENQLARVQQILMEELDVEREELTPESRIKEDLGADSLTEIQIVMKVEDGFNITLSDEAVEQAVTVEKLYEMLASQLEK